MGFNEAGWLGQGWHDLERDGRNGVMYRATGRVAELRVGAGPGASAVHVLLSGSPSLLGKPMRGRMRWRWDQGEGERGKEGTRSVKGEKGAEGAEGVESTAIRLRRDKSGRSEEGGGGEVGVVLARDGWEVHRMPLDGAGQGGVVRVGFEVEELVVPDRVLRNGDARALGFYVSAVWCV